MCWKGTRATKVYWPVLLGPKEANRIPSLSPHLKPNIKRSKTGFTLLEMITTVAIAAAVLLVLIKLFAPAMTFFQRTQIRQVAQRDSRMFMDEVRSLMSKGKVSTLTLSAPPQYSQADFSTIDGGAYRIYWSSSPANTVHIQRLSPAPVTDKVVATHVTQLSFALNLDDPTIIQVTFDTVFQINGSGRPDSFYKTHLENQTIVMDPS